MQIPSLIITPDHSPEERAMIIDSLAQRILKKGKVREAYDRLFGTQFPHVQIERLTRVNSKVFVREYNSRIFRLLSDSAVVDFYHDEEYVETQQMIHLSDWRDGKLLDRWQKYTEKPNPHHIVPRSR